ncbi:MAG: metallophosphoesterase family protein [Armatimonadetes bacterium]|nr:metallophosphoesterase family protein [Armatimonadota bacterium]
MKRRAKLLLFLLLLALPASLSAAPALHVGPYLQSLDRDAVTVVWETTEAVAGEVEATAAGEAPRRAADPEAATFHELRLTGLAPGTRYAYRVRWPGYASDAYSFRTAPPAGTRRFRLAVYGDSRTGVEAHADIAAHILADQPDLVLHTGDLVGDGTKLEQWKPQLFDPAAALMRSVCLFPVLGNHERNSPHYYRYFSLPGNEAWYAFDHANARFLALDAQQPCEPGSDQYEWLLKELQRPRPTWTILFLHAPPFSVHPTRAVSRLRWALQPLFQQYGVDMTFAGHDHHYARCHPVGPAFGPGKPVRHFITGGGGASLYAIADKPWSAVANRVYNYMLLDFDGDRVSAVAKDREDKVIDSFTIDRREPAPVEDRCAWEVLLWEKALNDAFRSQAAELVKPETTRVDATLRLPAPPFGSVRGELAWNTGPEAAWEFEAPTAGFAAPAGGELLVPLKGRCPEGKALPLPGATLRVSGGVPAWKFRNTWVVLQPFAGKK